jgi:hypothetical protein
MGTEATENFYYGSAAPLPQTPNHAPHHVLVLYAEFYSLNKNEGS